MTITSNVFWNGQRVTYTWIPTRNVGRCRPVKNVVGISINDKKEVLICREPNQVNWSLPGGRPEAGETLIQTLKRELMEEVDIKIDNIKPIGTQRVDFPNNPKKSEGELFYQVRYFCRVKELLPQTLDPDTGLLYERKFIPISELNKYLNWGKIGEVIVSRAIEFAEGRGFEPLRACAHALSKRAP